MKFVSQSENTRTILTVSIDISRHEKFFSVAYFAMKVDALGTRLLERVLALLEARPDLKDRKVLGHQIGRATPSWLSEFLNGNRTTNDLRLVVRMARVFGVSVGYLLGESDQALDPGAATLIATYQIVDERGRRLLLRVAAELREPSETTNPESHDAESRSSANKRQPHDAIRPKKR